jgi:DNA-binding Lrp family transcriptional regulator
MVNAVILLKVERNKINEIAEKISSEKGVSEVYSVGGRFDLVSVIRVNNNEKLAELVTEKLLNIDGIISSETLIAFKVHSRHDLEKMFAIGLEEND